MKENNVSACTIRIEVVDHVENAVLSLAAQSDDDLVHFSVKSKQLSDSKRVADHPLNTLSEGGINMSRCEFRDLARVAQPLIEAREPLSPLLGTTSECTMRFAPSLFQMICFTSLDADAATQKRTVDLKLSAQIGSELLQSNIRCSPEALSELLWRGRDAVESLPDEDDLPLRIRRRRR